MRLPCSAWMVCAGLAAACVAPLALAQGRLGIGPSQNASAHRKQVGEALSFVCPASDGAKASVYGTENYTDDSAICAAAIHAGVLKTGRAGVVTIRIGAGTKSFKGSERNGIASRTYEGWPHWYTFVREGEQGSIGWTTIWEGVPEGFADPVVVNCPAGGVTRAVIWGTDLYTPDSAICVAAVHAGVITPEHGGAVTVRRAPGAREYRGTERFGVASQRWGAFEAAFTVASASREDPPPEEPPPDEPPPAQPPGNLGVPPRTIALAGFAGTGPASHAGPILPRTFALTAITGVGPAPAPGSIGPRSIQSTGWTGVGPAP